MAFRITQYCLLAAVGGTGISSHAVELEEIVVTAQKRQQSIQDIGFSVGAFDEDDIRDYGNDVGALAGQVPGVESYGNGSYLQTFFIRGIGLNEFSGNYNAPVAIHLDEVYVSKNWMSARPTFDVGRIEVLKGPQGTLFGRNTTGGAVNYYTRSPSQQQEGYIRLNADNFSRYSAEAAFSGGLTDSLSGRVSVQSSFGNGGPQDNLFTGEEHGEPDVQQIRGQLQWQLETTKVRLMAYAGRDDSETLAYKGPGIFNDGAPGFCPEALAGQVTSSPSICPKFGGLASVPDTVTGPAGLPGLGRPDAEFEPAGVHDIAQNSPPQRNDSFAGAYLRIEHEIGDMLLTSLTSYDQYERDQVEDSDSSVLSSSDLYLYNDIDVFTQELRLTGTANDSSISYVAGIFYQYDDLRQVDSLDLTENPFNFAGAGLPPRLVGLFDQNVNSVAVFANTDFDISDRLTVTAGLRFTSDKTDINGETFAGLNDVRGIEDIPQTVLAVVSALDDERTDEDFSWRLGGTYDVDEDMMLYVNLTTGFRTGGYSVPFGGAIVQFDPEEIFSQEVGFKAQLLGNTLQLNAAAFAYQYDDLQVNVDDPVSPIVPITRNIGESETFGLEVDMVWLATENLQLRFGYSYLEAEFVETERVMTTLSSQGPIPLEGNTPVNTPENQFNAAANYSVPLNGSMALDFQLDARWVDERFLEVTNQPADVAAAYTVANARIGLASADGKWDVALWVKNLTDEEYLTYTNNLPGPGFKLDIFGEQRSYGASFGYRF